MKRRQNSSHDTSKLDLSDPRVRWIFALSIPVYVAIALIIATLLPRYSVFALIFIVLIVHSIYMLVRSYWK